MRVSPIVVYDDNGSPVYKCRCGHHFKSLELLSNPPQKALGIIARVAKQSLRLKKK